MVCKILVNLILYISFAKSIAPYCWKYQNDHFPVRIKHKHYHIMSSYAIVHVFHSLSLITRIHKHRAYIILFLARVTCFNKFSKNVFLPDILCFSSLNGYNFLYSWLYGHYANITKPLHRRLTDFDCLEMRCPV